MKRIFLIFLIFLISFPVFGKWRPLKMSELINNADLIVVARLDKVLSEETFGKKKTQIVKFQTERILKGKISKSFLVNASKTNICVPQYWFDQESETQFLLFLKTAPNNRFRVLNGSFGALPVKSAQITWFNDPGSSPTNRYPQPLDKVEQNILKYLSNNSDSPNISAE